MPYIYMHLLAFMIHMVNVLTAMGAGLQVGLLVAIALLVQSFVYQAFLTIGAALSFPVTGTAYRIPLRSMCLAMEYQLRLMNRIANFSEEDVMGMSDDVKDSKEGIAGEATLADAAI